MSKMLIIYYSWSNGNTKRIAEMLQEETKADIPKRDQTVDRRSKEIFIKYKKKGEQKWY